MNSVNKKISIFLIILILICSSIFLVEANNVSEVSTTSDVTIIFASLPSSWEELISPEGVFEPENPSLTGTHFSEFSIRFVNLSINNNDTIECFVRLPDTSEISINGTNLNLNGENYTLNYTVQSSDSIILDSGAGYLPWILKNCSIKSDLGTSLYNETINSRIYVHDDAYWTDDEITRAVTCAGTPGVYFNNTGKCEFAEDTMFALQMRNGNPVEESCFNDPGVGCSYDYCNGIFFPTCDPISYFYGYNASMDDPNNYATFSADFAGYTVPVAYTLYTNTSADGNFKLRITQTLSSKPYSFTIYNLTDVDATNTNVYGSDLGDGTLKVTDQGDGTFAVAYYNFDSYSGDLDFIFNISFTNDTLDENRTLSFVVAFGTSTNQMNPAYFDGRFSNTLGPKNNNESENTSATSVDYLGACSDRVNNDFDYLNLGEWSPSYDCYDFDCDGFFGDYNQTNEINLTGTTGLCNYNTETICSDEFDNDYNDYTDCHDADCFHNNVECPDTELICNDLINNDWDYTLGESDNAVDEKIENNGQKYDSTYQADLTDCEDQDCDNQVGGSSGELCNWEYETDCNDSFDNDALQLKDCELATLANTKDMPGVGSAEYDCAFWCQPNVLSTETGTLCDNNKDDDFDAVLVTGYYSGSENTASGAGTDCRWLTYNPDEECNLTTLSSGSVCELGHELTCNDMFDNDYDADGTASDHPSPGWDATTYNAVFTTYGLSYVQYADYDDYDCATNLPYAQNESYNASWCFDTVDNDMDQYYWDGSSWILNSSTGIDCSDPDCMGITNPDNTNQTCMEKEYDPADLFFQGLAIPGMYCTNSFDDDADNALGWPSGGMDCEDPDCNKQFDICSETYCYNSEASKWNSCANGLDDDYDMPTAIVDCEDPDCLGMIGDNNGRLCQSSETTCNDNFDNDANGNTDCEETSCIDEIGGKINGVNVYCRTTENSASDCFDGFDNDVDGNIDCYDSDCNSQCNLTNINGNMPLSLPDYSGQIALNSIDQSTEARIDSSTEKVRDGEYYNITFRGIAASTGAQWTIGTATSRFEKTNFDISTVALSGPDAGTFSITSTANGWTVQSTSGHPGGYVVTFEVRTNGTFTSTTYELTYAETNGGLISLNNYIDYETDENISPIANSIEVIPNSRNLEQNETVYIRANISDNYNLGQCHFTVSGAETLDLGTSNDCKDSFNPINEGTYYINVTPIDYYGNIGTDLQEQYDLNLMPKSKNISLNRIEPFYNQSIDVVTVNATFDVIAGDTLGNCEAIAIDSANTEISLGNFTASGNECSSNLDISSLSNGGYMLFVRVTETTEGDIIESDSTSLFICSETISGVCRFADYNADNMPDVCDTIKNVTVNLLDPLDNFDTNETEVNFSCYAESNNTLTNITLYVWNSSGDVAYSYVNPIFGTNDTSNWTTTLSNDNYSWNCLAYNDQDEYGWSDVNRTMSINYILEFVSPTVTLVSPVDSYSTTSTTITFIYQVNDSSNIANCSLFIDDIEEDIDTTITKGINQQFITNLGIGVYDWKIVCYDEFSNQGNSSSRQITVSTTTNGGTGGDVRRDDESVPEPSIALKVCWPEINNETVDAYIGKKEFGLERVKFFYRGYAKNPCLVIEGIPIEEITAKTDYVYEESYRAFKITTEVFDEKNISDIDITTSLTNSWLLLRNLDSLRLNRNTEIKKEGWEKSFASLINRDPGYSYFESKISGFSIFLITADLNVPPMCGNYVCESDLGENMNNCCTDCGCVGAFNRCSENKCVEDWTWLILLLLILLAIFSAYKLHRHMRNKNKYS